MPGSLAAFANAVGRPKASLDYNFSCTINVVTVRDSTSNVPRF